MRTKMRLLTEDVGREKRAVHGGWIRQVGEDLLCDHSWASRGHFNDKWVTICRSGGGERTADVPQIAGGIAAAPKSSGSCHKLKWTLEDERSLLQGSLKHAKIKPALL